MKYFIFIAIPFGIDHVSMSNGTRDACAQRLCRCGAIPHFMWNCFIFLFIFAACVPLPTNPVPDVDTPVIDDIAPIILTEPEIIRTTRAKDTLRLAMREPVTLNPLLNEDITVDHVLKLLFEPLVILDENLKPAAHLAEYNFSSDSSAVTLTLRKDAIWSDLVPVTADDIVFSVDVLRNAPANNIYKPCVANIAHCEKLDTKSVKINYHEINAASAYRLQFPIIPQHYYKGESNPASQKNNEPLGNGLYTFDHLRPLDSIMLAQNPYTFRPAAAIGKVEAIFIPDYETDFYAFQQGLVDTMAVEISEWSKRQSTKKARYELYPAMYYDFIGFNHDHPHLKNTHFRQALASAFDIDEAVTRIYLNQAARTLSPVNPASWLYAQDLPEHDYNPDYIRVWVNDLRDELSPFRILVNEENDEHKRIAQGFAAALRETGLEVSVAVCSFEEFSRQVEAGDYDIFVGCFYMDPFPDLRFAFHSDGNPFNYRDPELDGLLEAAVSAPSQDEHSRRMAELQYYFVDDLPVVSLVFRHGAILTDTRVQGELRPALWNTLAGVNGWRLE